MNLKSSPAKWVVSLPRPEVVNLIGLRNSTAVKKYTPFSDYVFAGLDTRNTPSMI
jgi:hypothetical protein